jgi:hypothetical protein
MHCDFSRHRYIGNLPLAGAGMSLPKRRTFAVFINAPAAPPGEAEARTGERARTLRCRRWFDAFAIEKVAAIKY